MRFTRSRTVCVALCCVVGAVGVARGAEQDFTSLADQFRDQINPLLRRYCTDCHATADPAGELDLERFHDLPAIRSDAGVWEHVAEMLDNGEMPPQDADQPPPEDRQRLRDWVARYLRAEALANAGDPGPVLIRRLNNAEYTYTIQDLTGVPLEPAREFPADGAAGEGFTNAAAAMVMSPALLTKYLDAAKEISRHAVFTPQGMRFSASTTRRDWTNELLEEIRAVYRLHTDASGASQVNLQGIVFDTNDGGRLPIEPYLAATVEERDALKAGQATIENIARSRRLNAKYLGLLWNALHDATPSPVLETIRARWRAATPADVEGLAADIRAWQQALWRFTSVGHIGKAGGPTRWQEPVIPLVSRQEFNVPVPVTAGASEVRLHLVVGDAGDGAAGDEVIWERPRFVAPGRRELLLRDVRRVSNQLTALREALANSVERCLAAAAEVSRSDAMPDVSALAARHHVRPEFLEAWLDFLGLGAGGATIDSHVKSQLQHVGGYEFVNGWGSPETPSLVANASDQHVRIPGNLRPRGLALHPSPTLRMAAGWRSPVSTIVRVSAFVQHAHPECGNGVTWSVEVRRGQARRTLAAGATHGGAEIAVGPFENVRVRPGDLIVMSVGPRDGNHSCDLTAVDLSVQSAESTWNLSGDVGSNILAGNPHADSHGHPDVWHFFTEPLAAESEAMIPAESILARWQASTNEATQRQLAAELQQLVSASSPPADSPDGKLRRQIIGLGGPLLSAVRSKLGDAAATDPPGDRNTAWGADPALFGRDSAGNAIGAADLSMRAPASLEIVLPSDLVDGYAFVATGRLASAGDEGSVQLTITDRPVDNASGLRPVGTAVADAGGAWTSESERISYAAPIVVNDGGAARRRFEADMEAFRSLFPIALCYTKIVPVDEVVTLTQFYREDDSLQRLMLDDAEIERLDQLWEELHFVSQDAFTQVDALEQLIQFATQDADPSVFEPLRGPFAARAEAFRTSLAAAEPNHLDAILGFASKAYRRPLAPREAEALRSLYRKLRENELAHEDALRLTLARVLVAPSFLYRLESTAQVGESPATTRRPIDNYELATRLSYFFWCSAPDDTLRALADAGALQDPSVIQSQARRMLGDPRIARMAEQFGCQWLHVYEFAELDEKSERHFPEFAALRGDMYQEAIRFLTDAFQRDATIIELYDADHTFVNERLAGFYGIAWDTNASPAQWRRVDGMRARGRGGVLGLAATLAKQSGASRTSPILRGNWVSEVLLGEKLPKPPAGVPVLPEDESATEGLTVRQLVERHVSDPSCAKCHQRIDPFGFALEGFDAIGRQRERDLADRPIDTRTKLANGVELNGLSDLRDYLIEQRRDAVVRQFCRKLLGYALGRSVQLSDQPLLDEMMRRLAENDDRLSTAIEAIVLSEQFRSKRVGGANETAATLR